MLECATEPYNPHLLGQAVDERGNDGGTERQRERKGGRMMEWLLNIQQAVKSMQGVVGRLLHYGGASVLHLFISLFPSILVLQLLSSVFSVRPVFQPFFHHSSLDIPSFFPQTLSFLIFPFLSLLFPSLCNFIFLFFLLSLFLPVFMPSFLTLPSSLYSFISFTLTPSVYLCQLAFILFIFQLSFLIFFCFLLLFCLVAF